jgi:GDPmannose 4,6-dehydratase
MWLMLQQDTADDFVVGTGESHTVREFVELAFAHAGLDWKQHVEVDARYFRPAEVDCLRADASKAAKVLDWEPAVNFDELVRIMVEADMEAAEVRLKGGPAALQFAIAAEGRSW